MSNAESLLGVPRLDEPATSAVDLTATPRDPQKDDEELVSLRERAKELDPDAMETVNEIVAEAMRLQKQKDRKLEVHEKTAGQLWESLSPAQKEAVLQTHHVRRLHGVSQNHPLWIDRKKVPEVLTLAWLSPKIVDGLGMRGYRRVEMTPTTQSWVPNARQLGSAKFITHGRYVLCAIDSDLMLERRVAAYRQTHSFLDEQDERFKSALRSVVGIAGLKRDEAEAVDRAGRGMIATRGGDPEYARRVRSTGQAAERDLVKGQGEE